MRKESAILDVHLQTYAFYVCIHTQVYTFPHTANLLYILSTKYLLLFCQPGVRPESTAPSTLNAQSL